MTILYNVFQKPSQNKARKTQIDNESSDKNKDAFKIGSSIANLITSSWNSQENPAKVYIFNRRVITAELELYQAYQVFSETRNLYLLEYYQDQVAVQLKMIMLIETRFTLDKKPTDNVGVDDDNLVSQASSLRPSAGLTGINSSRSIALAPALYSHSGYNRSVKQISSNNKNSSGSTNTILTLALTAAVTNRDMFNLFSLLLPAPRRAFILLRIALPACIAGVQGVLALEIAGGTMSCSTKLLDHHQ